MTLLVPPETSLAQSHHEFDRDASIVLVGALGTGKSTLATIAQSYFGLVAVDLADYAEKPRSEITSQPPQETHETARQTPRFYIDTLERTLQDRSRGCIIIWPARLLDEQALMLLLQYSKTHPIIHLTRSLTGVQRHLRIADAPTAQRFLQVGNRIYRAYSNFEFHNLDEDTLHHTTSGSRTRTEVAHGIDIAGPPRSLLLKNLERAFVRFINTTIRGDEPIDSQCTNGVLFPDARSPFTYILSVALKDAQAPRVRPALNCGADACQLEVHLDENAVSDFDARLMDEVSWAMAVLVRYFDGPVIYHIVFPKRLGLLGRYWALLRHGIRLGVQYMTVDMRLPRDQLASLVSNMSGRTLIVGNFHDDSNTSGWETEQRWDLYETASSLGMAGLRLTQPARSYNDNMAVLGFKAKAAAMHQKMPFLVAYNTGPEGRPSQFLNQVLTPVAVDGLSIGSAWDTPININAAQTALFALSVWDAMKFYIIGLDVTYALSPTVHRIAYEYFSMPHTFESLSIASLPEARVLLQERHLGGISLAQGFKLTVFSEVRAFSTHARDIGAINTLIPMRAGGDFDGVGPPPKAFWLNRGRAGDVVGLYGDNTDWIGMARCIYSRISPANAITSKTSALVVGAGGMARAAIYALIQLDVKHIVIYNRTIANAEKIADHFRSIKVKRAVSHSALLATGIPGHDVHHRRMQSSTKLDIRVMKSREEEWFSDMCQPTIIISCLPPSSVGGQSEADFTLPPAWMRSSTGGVVLDLNYQPLITCLLQQVWQLVHRGWVPIDGLDNLGAQASAQFELFTGRRPPHGLMRWHPS
jgi:shikimate 5-dehydrogenase